MKSPKNGDTSFERCLRKQRKRHRNIAWAWSFRSRSNSARRWEPWSQFLLCTRTLPLWQGLRPTAICSLKGRTLFKQQGKASAWDLPKFNRSGSQNVLAIPQNLLERLCDMKDNPCSLTHSFTNNYSANQQNRKGNLNYTNSAMGT